MRVGWIVLAIDSRHFRIEFKPAMPAAESRFASHPEDVCCFAVVLKRVEAKHRIGLIPSVP